MKISILEITDLLHTDEIDFVILNKAPITLSRRILQSKKILIDKDRFLRHRFESLTFRKFFDFQYREKESFKRRLKIALENMQARINRISAEEHKHHRFSIEIILVF